MPGRRQPSSLEVLSLRQVCRQLDRTCRRLQVLSQVSSASQILAFAKQNIRPYYRNALPGRLRSQVIEETSRMLYGPASDGSTLISGPAPLYLLALLLGHDIKQLKVNLCCYYGCSHQASMLKLLAHEGVGLESLELARSALLRLDCKLLHSALLSVKNLLSLTIRNIADDGVLQVLGRTCPKLVVLDVGCSRQVTDVGLKQLLLQVELRDKPPRSTTHETTSWSRLKTLLSKLKIRRPNSGKKDKQSVLLEYYESRNFLCNTLKVLNIANTSVSSAGVLLALVHAPQLESLAEYNHMGRVVEIMSRSLGTVKTPFGLTQVKSSRTSANRLQLLAQACPQVVKLHISEVHHPPETLRLFSHITTLTLHGIPSQGQWLDKLYEYLRTDGQKLQELNLRTTQDDNPPKMDLREIYRNCPNLVTLTSDGSSVTWTTGSDPSYLKYLKKIHLGHAANATTVSKIFQFTPELKVLHIYSCHDLTNEHIDILLSVPAPSGKYPKTVVTENSLIKKLVCFYIYEAPQVSANAVLKMFKTCVKLKRIGNLTNWGLDCEGVKTIRTALARDNLDVDLCPGAHWFWNNCIR